MIFAGQIMHAQVEAQAAVIGVWQPTPPPTFTAQAFALLPTATREPTAWRWCISRINVATNRPPLAQMG